MKIQVLQQGFNFCPTHNIDEFEVIKDLQLFGRRLLLKTIYGPKTTPLDQPSALKQEAMDNLV